MKLFLYYFYINQYLNKANKIVYVLYLEQNKKKILLVIIFNN